MTDRGASTITGRAKSLEPSEERLENIFLDLQVPPQVRNMPLRRALFGQIGYWGVTRTIRSYERCIKATVDLSQSMAEFIKAQTELERQKEYWRNIDDIREAARLKVRAEVAEQQARLQAAQLAANSARIENEAIEDQLADRETRRKIAQNNLQADLVRSEKKLNEINPAPKGSFKERFRAMQEQAKDIVAIEREIEKLIRQYGGEENIPPSLVDAIELFREDMRAELGGV